MTDITSTPYTHRLRFRCQTEFSVPGPDGQTITTKCGTDFLDSTRDHGGGVIFKRGLTKITRQGIFLVCPKCHHTSVVGEEVIDEVLDSLATYKDGSK